MQSRRHKSRHYRGRLQPTREQLDAKLARALADRLSRPCPPRPVEHPPGAHRGSIVITLDGRELARLDLHQPPAKPLGRRTRCDSLEGRHDWLDAPVIGGWHALFRALVAHLIPRQMSRRAVASMEV